MKKTMWTLNLVRLLVLFLSIILVGGCGGTSRAAATSSATPKVRESSSALNGEAFNKIVADYKRIFRDLKLGKGGEISDRVSELRKRTKAQMKGLANLTADERQWVSDFDAFTEGLVYESISMVATSGTRVAKIAQGDYEYRGDVEARESFLKKEALLDELDGERKKF